MHAGQLVYENVKRETEDMRPRKRRPWPLPTNQVEQFYYQPLGQEKGDSLSNLNCHWVLFVRYDVLKEYLVKTLNPER